MNNIGIGDKKYYEDHYLSRNWMAYRNILSKLVLTQTPGRVLDLGAGLGYFVEACTKWGIDCEGLEGSIDAVLMAKSRINDLKISYGLLSDELPYENEIFSTVILNQVIEHLESNVAKKLIKEIHRVLKPGGGIIIFSPCFYNKAELYEDPTHINMYTPSALKKFICNNGFSEYLAFDDPMAIFGKSYYGYSLAKIIFKLTNIDRLSASANCVAKKL